MAKAKLSSDLCLDTTSCFGRRVIFTTKQREQHEDKRPELRGKDGDKFITGRVRETIQKPDFIYRDCTHPKDRRAYYKIEYFFEGKPRYTKVIIHKKKRFDFVKTAYRPDSVKERGREQLIYGNDKYAK